MILISLPLYHIKGLTIISHRGCDHTLDGGPGRRSRASLPETHGTTTVVVYRLQAEVTRPSSTTDKYPRKEHPRSVISEPKTWRTGIPSRVLGSKSLSAGKESHPVLDHQSQTNTLRTQQIWSFTYGMHPETTTMVDRGTEGQSSGSESRTPLGPTLRDVLVTAPVERLRLLHPHPVVDPSPDSSRSLGPQRQT